MRQLIERIKFWLVKPDEWFWSDDLWERMFDVAESAAVHSMPDMDISHSVIFLGLYTGSFEELCHRLDLLYRHVNEDLTTDHVWKARRREIVEVCLTDYVYSEKVGYRSLQEVLELLLKKLAAIHNLFEQCGMGEDHPYYQYMIREFKSIPSDCCVVLEKLYELKKP